MTSLDIQAVFSGSVGNTESLMANVPPQVPGDLLTGLTVYFSSNSTVSNFPLVSLFCKFYACNSQPTTVAEAKTGIKLLDVQLPLMFNLASNLSEGQVAINLSIPLFRKIALGETYLAIVSNVNVATTSLIGVYFARLTRYDD